MALCFGQNIKTWPRHGLDNYIFKGTLRPYFLISLPCKCHLKFRELRSIVTLYRVTFLDPTLLFVVDALLHQHHHHVSVVRRVRLNNDNSSNSGAITTTTTTGPATATGARDAPASRAPGFFFLDYYAQNFKIRVWNGAGGGRCDN